MIYNWNPPPPPNKAVVDNAHSSAIVRRKKHALLANISSSLVYVTRMKPNQVATGGSLVAPWWMAMGLNGIEWD